MNTCMINFLDLYSFFIWIRYTKLYLYVFQDVFLLLLYSFYIYYSSDIPTNVIRLNNIWKYIASWVFSSFIMGPYFRW